jgi:cis-3-alkyl-4-acyloxetan-2-one decarboxylase
MVRPMEAIEYPFENHYAERDGLTWHYLDEGEGPTLVMLHGNPSWSIYYRKLVLALRDRYRCIVPDHMGCGLSDKPGDADYDYTLSQRVDDLEALLDELGVTGDITLIVHDWGGMIGMAYAVRHPQRIARIVAMNTAVGHLPETKTFPALLRLARTPLGAVLVRGFNGFARLAANVCCTRNKMPRNLRDAYCRPYGSWNDRIATLRFVQDIPLDPHDKSYPVVDKVDKEAGQFANRPMLLCWGMKDFVFSHHFLAVWEKKFPQAEVHRFDDCAHYILEDATDEVIGLIGDFLARTGISA